MSKSKKRKPPKSRKQSALAKKIVHEVIPQLPPCLNLDIITRKMLMLANPHRLRIIEALLKKPRSPMDLVQIVGVNQSTVSHNLMLMQYAGMVTSERMGRKTNYSLVSKNVFAADGYRVVVTRVKG